MNKKYLSFVNTSAIHDVSESGYNQMLLALFLFFYV